ncbi:MAG: fibronectin type III domain-containing protein [Chthoniobacterales bacterium]|nr:fibronectin type III domain-containing protein [Chthoniobacterales bacterium]
MMNMLQLAFVSSLPRSAKFCLPVLLLAAFMHASHALQAGFDNNWPSRIEANSGTVQVLYSNLPVTNITSATASLVSSSVPANTTGFQVSPSPGTTQPVSGDGAGSNSLILYFTPGTNAAPFTNTVQIALTNSPGATGASTNIDIVVFPSPAQLEIRFYNSSTNAASQVFILPNAKQDPPNPNFTWTNTNTGANSWTNWMATTKKMTVTLADIGVTGTNTAGQSYYSVYTTNFNNAAWWVSYGGGHLPAPTNGTGAWDGTTLIGAPPNAGTPSGPWGFHQWNTFEVTLDGSAQDVGDTTYINQFSIPLAMRVFTSVTNDSTKYYQHGGWTNFSKSNFNILASNMITRFTNALWRSPNGSNAVLVAFPSSAAAGSVVTPIPAAYTPSTPNSFPLFADYFNAVKTNTARTNKIKDMISLDDTNGGNGAWLFFYDFDLAVTASNTLLLSGKIFTTNNSTNGPNAGLNTNATGLTMEIGADTGGPTDNWATWTVYTAPTPAGFTWASNSSTPNHLLRYSTNSWVPSNLTNERVLKTSAGWTSVAAFSGYTAADDIALYNNKFGTAIMGRILGDLAAGFALGFVNSSVVNPAYTANYAGGSNTAYGDSPSGSWWGGNLFPLCGTNRLAFGGVQPARSTNNNTFYSEFGGMIHDSGTKLTYMHPIYDRMQVYGGQAVAAGTPKQQLQPSTATNAIPPIFVVEIEMYDGLLSAPQPVLPPDPGAVPVYQAPTNAYSAAQGLTEGNAYGPSELSALQMRAPASWVVQGLPAGVTFSNKTNNGIVYGSISGTPAAGSGLNPPRIYAVNAIMSNSYDLVATNVSGPLNTKGFYVQVSTTGVAPANTPATLVAVPSPVAPMTALLNAPSSPASFLVQGVNLSNTAVTVTAPAGFQVSTNSVTGFGGTATLTATNAPSLLTTNLAPVPVYVRLAASGTAGTLSGNVTVASSSVPSTQVAVTGTVSGAPAPAPPSAPTITGITPGNSQLAVAFTPPLSGAPFNNYEYSTDGGSTWTAHAPVVTSSPLIITGLVNGTTYPVQIRAVNTAGSGAASATVNGTPTATPAPVPPGAPTITSIIPGNQRLTVSFTAPSSDGGSAITNYEYSTDGGTTWNRRSPASTSSPISITGLANGTTYAVCIRALNSAGYGAASNAVNGTPVPDTPSEPTITSILPGNQQLSVVFTAPVYDGGAPVTNYEYSTDNGASWNPHVPAVTTSPVVITGLTNGVDYTVRIRAVNAAGPGDDSNPVEGTPTGSPVPAPPSAPSITLVQAGNGQLTVDFLPPADDGGAPVNNYEFSTSNGAVWTRREPASAASPLVITGLSNGTTYQLKIRAVNLAGHGAASTAVSGTPTDNPSSFLAYNTWLTAYPGLTNTSPGADPDGDGFSNVKEYAFDGNPTVGTPSLLASSNSGAFVVFRFVGLKGAAGNYAVQNSTNLSTSVFTNTAIPVATSADQSGVLLPSSYERREFSVPLGSTNNFYRVLFTNQ